MQNNQRCLKTNAFPVWGKQEQRSDAGVCALMNYGTHMKDTGENSSKSCRLTVCVCVCLIYNVAYVWVVLLPSSKKQPPFPSWWQESSSSHLGTAPWWSTIKQWSLCMIYQRSNKWTGWANIWGFYLALAFSFYSSFSIENMTTALSTPQFHPQLS